LSTSLLALLDEIRAIAQLGLLYAENPYDQDRYQRLLRLAAGEYAALSGVDENALVARLREEVGYITPKTGCNGVIFNDEGHVLLVQRSDNGKWCLPGGFAEVNMTPQDNCRREVWEETGLDVRVGTLVDVFCVLPGQYDQPNTHYILVYLCEVIGGTLTPSHETPVVGFYDWRKVTDWHSSHRERTARAYEKWLEIRSS
jgi:ADP-ribose pyrophosphatase YjhB (NUDIX family)